MRSLYKDPDGKNVFEEKEHIELKVKGIVMLNNVNQESSVCIFLFNYTVLLYLSLDSK